MDIANREHQYFMANRAFAATSSLTRCRPRWPASTPSHCPNAAPPPNFAIDFTPLGSQAADGDLSLNSEGEKGPRRRSGCHDVSTPMNRQRGISLIEVLITMVILAIGLLGLVGLQGRLQVLQMESYQRAQALMLLQDMSSRIALNRDDAAYLRDRFPARRGHGLPDHGDAHRGGRPRLVQRAQGAGETIGGGNVGSHGRRPWLRRGSRRRPIPRDHRLAGHGAGLRPDCGASPVVRISTTARHRLREMISVAAS